MYNKSNCQALTLADIFFMTLEKMSKDDKFKSFVRKVKTLMDVPECAEYLNCVIINEMGYPTPIAADTVDKAIDCIVHFYEDYIEENRQWTRVQKANQKVYMREFMAKYRDIVMNYIASNKLLK